MILKQLCDHVSDLRNTHDFCHLSGEQETRHMAELRQKDQTRSLCK
jgi:hypothetical protein